MKAYIAGKITGDVNYKEKFEKLKKSLEIRGYIVLNPAELPSGMTNSDYMRICLSMIDISDTIYFLPGYKDSPGAMVEFNYAAYIGKKINMLSDIWLNVKIGHMTCDGCKFNHGPSICSNAMMCLRDEFRNNTGYVSKVAEYGSECLISKSFDCEDSSMHRFRKGMGHKSCSGCTYDTGGIGCSSTIRCMKDKFNNLTGYKTKNIKGE